MTEVPSDVPWYLKYGARGVGCGGGIIALGLGAINCITFSSACLIAGILQMIAAFIVISIEAPFFCSFVEFVQTYSQLVDNRPPWQKAALYVIVSVPSILFCQNISILFGSGLLFLTGVLYGMMAVGKKASRNDMIAAAHASHPEGSTNMKQTLVTMNDSEAKS